LVIGNWLLGIGVSPLPRPLGSLGGCLARCPESGSGSCSAGYPERNLKGYPDCCSVGYSEGYSEGNWTSSLGSCGDCCSSGSSADCPASSSGGSPESSLPESSESSFPSCSESCRGDCLARSLANSLGSAVETQEGLTTKTQRHQEVEDAPHPYPLLSEERESGAEVRRNPALVRFEDNDLVDFAAGARSSAG